MVLTIATISATIGLGVLALCSIFWVLRLLVSNEHRFNRKHKTVRWT